jgi:hypothetical protein
MLARGAIERMDAGFDGYRRGLLFSEEPYMSHLNEQLLAGECRINIGGGKSSLMIDRQLKVLHRKGQHSRDKFGADLAAKVVLASTPPKIKVALFQIKLSDSSSASLDLAQLHDLATEPLADKRGFVMFVDRNTGVRKVASAADLWNLVPASKQRNVEDAIRKGKRSKRRHRVELSAFASVSEWLKEWFECKVGELSSDGSEEVLFFSDPTFQKPSDAQTSDEGSGRLGKVLVGEIFEMTIRTTPN